MKKYYREGYILPIAIVFSVIGLAMVFSYFDKVYNEKWRVDSRIAETKAYYNAETGLAEKAFNKIVQSDFEDTLVTFSDEYQVSGMGYYTDVELRQFENKENRMVRAANATGVSFLKNLEGKVVDIVRKKKIAFKPLNSLAQYMYLTADERAGGGPKVYNGNDRREVTFGSGDNLGGGHIQTNGTFVMSDFGCPEFQNTVWLTMDGEGNVNYPDMGSCNESQTFQGDPPLDTMGVVCLPPPGYERMKVYAHYTYDSTEKLRWGAPAFRDTLIMTDIEFLPDGGYRINRWWYLMPPNLNQGIGMVVNPDPMDLDGIYLPSAQCDDVDDLRTCDPYKEAMSTYHAKFVSNSGNESYLDPKVCGTHGFHHFGFPQWPGNTLSGFPLDVFPGGPVAIYIKGGPVRVHGTFKGKYTIVTDEYVPYRRHAWPSNSSAPIDTVWCNIWITDDIVNADASTSGSLAWVQPEADCSGGSDNIMGLVSGANVIIANTAANGAGNSSNGGSNIVINAHIIAFNESFNIQYWQNTLSGAASQFSNPPWGDGLGNGLFGSTGNQDDRGTVSLWGGVVQKYRGYMKRNNPGPYPTGDIGMDKNYNYDNNLKCNDPPLYPEDIDCSDGSIDDEFDIKIDYYKDVE
jgi:hypothetical protein